MPLLWVDHSEHATKNVSIFIRIYFITYTISIMWNTLLKNYRKNEAGLNCTSYNPSSFLYMNLNFFPLFIRVRYILPKKMLQNIFLRNLYHFLRNLSFFARGKTNFCVFIYYVMSNFVEYKNSFGYTFSNNAVASTSFSLNSSSNSPWYFSTIRFILFKPIPWYSLSFLVVCNSLFLFPS